MPRRQVDQLYYITHVVNIPSILRQGILSHQRVLSEGVTYEPIYDADIVANRKEIQAPNGKSLWSFANVYFQPRNAMLYRVLLRRKVEEVAVLSVSRDILNSAGAFISMGNAASAYSEIVSASEKAAAVPQILRWISNEYWTEEMGLKRKMMAECLIPEAVPPEYVHGIFVGSHNAASRVSEILGSAGVGSSPPVAVEPHMFFLPAREIPVTPLLSVAEGDMFFSRMQSLTVSVNTVGIMGKGLASRAKYQFPDVYVVYQDLCRTKKLRMGKPYLYKREKTLDYELAEEPPPELANSETWFLLFPTKRHWRENADFEGIDAGLQWVVENYKREGIKSLAVPALGCGLGRLDWADVGPLLCDYLSRLNLPVRIYLPAEKKIPDQLLSPEFLLRRTAVTS